MYTYSVTVLRILYIEYKMIIRTYTYAHMYMTRFVEMYIRSSHIQFFTFQDSLQTIKRPETSKVYRVIATMILYHSRSTYLLFLESLNEQIECVN